MKGTPANGGKCPKCKKPVVATTAEQLFYVPDDQTRIMWCQNCGEGWDPPENPFRDERAI